MKPDNTTIPERYLPTLAIWHNLLRFWCPFPDPKHYPPEWAISTNFYHGVRREYNQQIAAILDEGGDAYTKVSRIRAFINQ